MTSSLFNPVIPAKTAKKPESRKKSIMLSPKQLRDFNELKQTLAQAYYELQLPQPSENKLFQKLISDALESALVDAKKLLNKAQKEGREAFIEQEKQAPPASKASSKKK